MLNIMTFEINIKYIILAIISLLLYWFLPPKKIYMIPIVFLISILINNISNLIH